MGTLTDLINEAAIIRDATLDNENTAYRIGNMHLETLTYIRDSVEKEISKKVDISKGKGLSTFDYDKGEKDKIETAQKTAEKATDLAKKAEAAAIASDGIAWDADTKAEMALNANVDTNKKIIDARWVRLDKSSSMENWSATFIAANYSRLKICVLAENTYYDATSFEHGSIEIDVQQLIEHIESVGPCYFTVVIPLGFSNPYRANPLYCRFNVWCDNSADGLTMSVGLSDPGANVFTFRTYIQK